MSKQLVKLSQKILGPELQNAFVELVEAGVTSPHALIWMQNPIAHGMKTLTPPDYLPNWIQFVEAAERPGKDAMHEAGAYYVMDPSSALMMVGAFQLKATSVLDMCAAPGGKSAIAWRALQPQTLVCNEVVSKRHRALTSNLARCHIDGIVTQQDPSNWATSDLKFDLVIVDAPCSGQSLYARGEAETGCFHPSTVNGCRLRQRRIIAESAKCVAPGGHMIYSTCTYAPEENEDIIEWFLKKNPNFKARAVPELAPFKSQLTDASAYRFFPSQELGSGGFTALLQNQEDMGPHQSVDVPDSWIKWRLR